MNSDHPDSGKRVLLPIGIYVRKMEGGALSFAQVVGGMVRRKGKEFVVEGYFYTGEGHTGRFVSDDGVGSTAFNALGYTLLSSPFYRKDDGSVGALWDSSVDGPRNALGAQVIPEPLPEPVAEVKAEVKPPRKAKAQPELEPTPEVQLEVQPTSVVQSTLNLKLGS